MSGSIYDNVISNIQIPASCPECAFVFTVKLGQVGSTVTCPHCNSAILLKPIGSDMNSIKQASDSLEETLDSLTK